MFHSARFSSCYGRPYESYQGPSSHYLAQQQSQQHLDRQRAIMKHRASAARAQRLLHTQHLQHHYSHGDSSGICRTPSGSGLTSSTTAGLGVGTQRAGKVQELGHQLQMQKIQIQQHLSTLRLRLLGVNAPLEAQFEPPRSRRPLPAPPTTPVTSLEPAIIIEPPTPSTTPEDPSREDVALRIIARLERRFEAISSSFTFPSAIDFHVPVITVTVDSHQPPVSRPRSGHHHPAPPLSSTRQKNSSFPSPSIERNVPGLAFTPRNSSLLAYIEVLNQTLFELDGVDSCGDAFVRKRRSWVIERVETEIGRVEMYWKQAWAGTQISSMGRS
jgi:hypothetical protein